MFCQLTRGMVVGMLYPVLKESGHKLAPNEAYFAVFAGLRGALGTYGRRTARREYVNMYGICEYVWNM